MILTSYGGKTCWLLPFAPNTDDAVKVEVAVPVDYRRSKEGPSSRRPQGSTVRIAMTWVTVMTAAEFVALRNGSMQAQDEPFVVPFWPFSYAAGSAPTLTGSIFVGWNPGWLAWAFSPALTYASYAPVVWGRLKQPPRLVGREGNYVHAEISFFEDGPYPVLPSAATDTMFATPGGSTAPVWPWLWEGSTDPLPGAASVEVDRKVLGPGRGQSTIYFPQTPERTQQASFLFKSAASAAAAIGWWQRRAGGSDAHWIPTTQAVGQLAVDAVAGALQLQFKSAPILPVGDTSLCLSTPGGQLAYVKILAPAGTVIPLAVPLAATWPATWTNVTIAILARHSDDKLTLDCKRADTGWLARSAINWQELANEYTAPAGETLGTTLGRLASTAWFFEIDLDYAGAIQSWYFTNWEGGSITVAGQTWTYNACDFNQITQSDDLEDDGFTFDADWLANGPWANWLPGALAAVGRIKIFTGSVDSLGNVSAFTQQIAADLSEPTIAGTRVKQKSLGMNALFARQAPRMVYSPACSTQLFSARCAVALAAYTFSATIVSIAGETLTIGTFTGSLPAGFAALADWFALGTARWTSSGLPMRSMILTSTVIAAGQVTLTVDRPIPLAVGAVVSVVPGCNLLRDDSNGCAKFANQINHQGFADIPAISPSFILPVRNANSQAKK